MAPAFVIHPKGPAIAPPDVWVFQFLPGMVPRHTRDLSDNLQGSEEIATFPINNPNSPPDISEKDQLTATGAFAAIFVGFLVFMVVMFVFRKIRQRKRATGAGQPLFSDVQTGEDGNMVFDREMLVTTKHNRIFSPPISQSFQIQRNNFIAPENSFGYDRTYRGTLSTTGLISLSSAIASCHDSQTTPEPSGNN